ncbi:carbohydrate-binding module family 50 protein [Lepidopterella palustris CBS 459.81]|uniref:Carbohydrate-binding module family 50 protein n=1 Tax=Lepidopterella palustris CBS 459.81 TaxID=1314670 RepID=A0A8E2J9G3_9PEZI|nr:carbohydrate-binding module family 50 protein [Lepidopterella palustris CBS 459.81]
MCGSSLIYVTFLALGFRYVRSQQLQGASTYMAYHQLSPSCQDALNTSVACPFGLGSLASDGGMIDSDGTTALCVDSCHSSLLSAQSTIAEACTSTDDIVVFNDVAYPATFFVDNYLLAYSMACRTDSTTGQYCDPQLLAWAAQGYLNSTQICSDCWLGVQALQLNSPLGYDDGLATNFASLTSSCGVTTGYTFTTPAAYALNSTATTPPPLVTATPPPTCTGSYSVQATDDCNSVAQALNVSTYNLLYENNLDIYCQNFAAAVNSTLCIPPTCDLYTWQALDTCASIVSTYPGMTIPQFLSWNPNFNDLCQNAGGFQGYQVCVSPPGGYAAGTSTNGSTTGIATSAAPVPTNAANGTKSYCGLWYTVRSGDTCGQVSVANGISLSDFYFLNPEIDSQCTNLQLGVSYCVEAVGNIATYTGYSTPAGGSITVPPANFSSVNTAIQTPTPTGYDYTQSLMPTASGTISGCKVYANYNASSNAESDCDYVAFAYQVTTDQLLAWNPSLSSNLSTCNLQDGYSYCVVQTNTTTYTPNYCIPVNASTIMPGTTSDCSCYTTVLSYYNSTYGCADIESDYSITSTELTTWNTWLASDCDSNLYAGMTSEDIRPICIGVNGTSTPTSSQTPSVTSSSSSMGPTATGEVPGCLQYYTVQSGDGCSSIETKFSITFAQLYQWNPSIGSDCESLWLGYAYCVVGPPPATTTSAVGPPAPTQTGIASNCNAYYTVVSGDSCAAIESRYGITFAQLYQWNPAIGDDCQSLGVGYAVCVGVSS